MRDSRRILIILKYLYENTDYDTYETTVSILEHLKSQGIEINRKTLTNDMEMLVEMNVGLEKIKSSPNRYRWSKKLFKLAELQILVDSVLAARFITVEKSNEIIEKLATIAGKQGAKQLKNHIGCIGMPKTDNVQLYHSINLITDAISNHIRVAFKYTEYDQVKMKSYKNNGECYKVSPYKLCRNGDNYYIIGWDEKHAGVTVFRMDRVEECRTLDNNYRNMPDGFVLSDYSDKYFQMFDGDEKLVRMQVRNDLMKYIVDKFGRNVDTESKDEETFFVKAKVRVSPTFYGWVFQFAGGIKIMEPAGVVEEYKQMLSKQLTGLQMTK